MSHDRTRRSEKRLGVLAFRAHDVKCLRDRFKVVTFFNCIRNLLFSLLFVEEVEVVCVFGTFVRLSSTPENGY